MKTLKYLLILNAVILTTALATLYFNPEILAIYGFGIKQTPTISKPIIQFPESHYVSDIDRSIALRGDIVELNGIPVGVAYDDTGVRVYVNDWSEEQMRVLEEHNVTVWEDTAYGSKYFYDEEIDFEEVLTQEVEKFNLEERENGLNEGTL